MTSFLLLCESALSLALHATLSLLLGHACNGSPLPCRVYGYSNQGGNASEHSLLDPRGVGEQELDWLDLRVFVLKGGGDSLSRECVTLIGRLRAALWVSIGVRL